MAEDRSDLRVDIEADPRTPIPGRVMRKARGFLIEEAKRIVFEGVVPAQRSPVHGSGSAPQDGHDVLATYRQLVNLGTRAPSAISTGEFEEEIKARHADLMSGRRENAPGHCKQEPNAAGNTLSARGRPSVR